MKAGLSKEGKPLFIHLHLCMSLPHFMKGLEGLEETAYMGMYGSTTNNVTRVSQCLTLQPDQDPKALNRNKFYNANILHDSAETPEVGPR